MQSKSLLKDTIVSSYYPFIRTPKREANFELLRLVSMILLLFTHFIINGGFGEYTIGINYILFKIIKILSFVSVNIFVLISAYFLCSKHFDVIKLVKTWGIVWIYSMFLYLISLAFGVNEFNGNEFARAMFPVITQQYWFISAYLLMYTLAPFLNIIVRNITMVTHLFLCILVLIISLLSVELSFFQSLPIGDGTNTIWFCCVYLIGSFIRVYNISTLFKLWPFLLILYLGLNALMYFGYLTLEFSSPAILTNSVIVFMLFKSINIKGERLTKIICYISSMALAIYLIAIHPAWIDYLFNDLFTTQKFFAHEQSFLIAIGFAMCTYLACTSLEAVRRFLSRLIGSISKLIYVYLQENSQKKPVSLESSQYFDEALPIIFDSEHLEEKITISQPIEVIEKTTKLNVKTKITNAVEKISDSADRTADKIAERIGKMNIGIDKSVDKIIKTKKSTSTKKKKDITTKVNAEDSDNLILEDNISSNENIETTDNQ